MSKLKLDALVVNFRPEKPMGTNDEIAYLYHIFGSFLFIDYQRKSSWDIKLEEAIDLDRCIKVFIFDDDVDAFNDGAVEFIETQLLNKNRRYCSVYVNSLSAYQYHDFMKLLNCTDSDTGKQIEKAEIETERIIPDSKTAYYYKIYAEKLD